jgi:hypothetical protein
MPQMRLSHLWQCHSSLCLWSYYCPEEGSCCFWYRIGFLASLLTRTKSLWVGLFPVQGYLCEEPTQTTLPTLLKGFCGPYPKSPLITFLLGTATASSQRVSFQTITQFKHNWNKHSVPIFTKSQPWIMFCEGCPHLQSWTFHLQLVRQNVRKHNRAWNSGRTQLQKHAENPNKYFI